MEKSHFLTLLDNHTAIGKEDTLALANAKSKYPYSQLLHTLTAYGMQKNDMEGKAMQLQLAAVYATDRSVLKAVFEATPATQNIPTPRVAQKQDIVIAKEKPPAKVEPFIQPVEVNLEGDELLAEIFKDITRLKAVKHAFELSADAFSKEYNSKTTIPQGTKKDKPVKKTKPASKSAEGIIAEIKSSKKKIKPSDPKQKEQLDIIDQFIRTKPSIGKPATGQSAQPGDLAENSTQFTENIISETLVEILIKQGKKDKAVEVLRKLIWKYPQKKAYFAAQIQELIN